MLLARTGCQVGYLKCKKLTMHYFTAFHMLCIHMRNSQTNFNFTSVPMRIVTTAIFNWLKLSNVTICWFFFRQRLKFFCNYKLQNFKIWLDAIVGNHLRSCNIVQSEWSWFVLLRWHIFVICTCKEFSPALKIFLNIFEDM